MAFAQTLLRKMLNDAETEKHYDVFFVVNSTLRDGTHSQARLGAHRVVLCAISDRFEQSFAHPLHAPGKRNGVLKACNEIYVEHCSPPAVREALEIMYGGELKEAKSSVLLALEVWHFGVMFQVEHLVRLARGCCMSNLSTENCLRILEFAVHVEDLEIVDKLQNYACENANFSHVVTSPDFERLDFKVVSSLVRPGKGECAWPDILTFEKVWFDALVKWLGCRVVYVEKERGGYGEGGEVGDRGVRRMSEESVELIEKVLKLVDFSRMKTHELREVSRNEIAVWSGSFSTGLVEILLTRAEQLENTILERNVDLDVLGQKYQQSLGEQDEAERKARAAIDQVNKMEAIKVSLERKVDEMRRRKPVLSSGASSFNNARRKMSAKIRQSMTSNDGGHLDDDGLKKKTGRGGCSRAMPRGLCCVCVK